MKIVIRDVSDKSLFIIDSKTWKYIDLFQHGWVTDEMRVFFDSDLDEDSGEVSFTATGTNGPDDLVRLFAAKFFISFVKVR